MSDPTQSGPTLYWLSFADPNKPPGEQFLGVVILRARDFGEAIDHAWRMGVNPGGAVEGMPIPPEWDHLVPDSYKARLLTRAECEALDALMDGGPHD